MDIFPEKGYQYNTLYWALDVLAIAFTFAVVKPFWLYLLDHSYILSKGTDGCTWYFFLHNNTQNRTNRIIFFENTSMKLPLTLTVQIK